MHKGRAVYRRLFVVYSSGIRLFECIVGRAYVRTLRRQAGGRTSASESSRGLSVSDMAGAAAVVLFPVLLVGARSGSGWGWGSRGAGGGEGGGGGGGEGDVSGYNASSSSLLSSGLAYDETTTVPSCCSFVEVVSRSFPVAFVQASLVYYLVAVFLHYVVPWVLAGRVALASVQKGRREAGQVRREAVASLVRCSIMLDVGCWMMGWMRDDGVGRVDGWGGRERSDRPPHTNTPSLCCPFTPRDTPGWT